MLPWHLVCVHAFMLLQKNIILNRTLIHSWSINNISAESTTSKYACPQTLRLLPRGSGLSD